MKYQSKPESFLVTAILIGAVVLIGIMALTKVKTLVDSHARVNFFEVRR